MIDVAVGMAADPSSEVATVMCVGIFPKERVKLIKSARSDLLMKRA